MCGVGEYGHVRGGGGAGGGEGDEGERDQSARLHPSVADMEMGNRRGAPVMRQTPAGSLPPVPKDGRAPLGIERETERLRWENKRSLFNRVRPQTGGERDRERVR